MSPALSDNTISHILRVFYHVVKRGETSAGKPAQIEQTPC